jgi:hypothetical protein
MIGYDESRTYWKVGTDERGRKEGERAVILPNALSFLDSFLSKTQLPFLLSLSSWCCRNRLDQHRRRNVVAFNCRRVLGSTPNR